jgi:hypothetical protein
MKEWSGGRRWRIEEESKRTEEGSRIWLRPARVERHLSILIHRFLFLSWNFKKYQLTLALCYHAYSKPNHLEISENKRSFTQIITPVLSSKNKLCFIPGSYSFLAWPVIRTLRWSRHVPPKRRLTFNRLHGVMWEPHILHISVYWSW